MPKKDLVMPLSVEEEKAARELAQSLMILYQLDLSKPSDPRNTNFNFKPGLCGEQLLRVINQAHHFFIGKNGDNFAERFLREKGVDIRALLDKEDPKVPNDISFIWRDFCISPLAMGRGASLVSEFIESLKISEDPNKKTLYQILDLIGQGRAFFTLYTGFREFLESIVNTEEAKNVLLEILNAERQQYPLEIDEPENIFSSPPHPCYYYQDSTLIRPISEIQIRKFIEQPAQPNTTMEEKIRVFQIKEFPPDEEGYQEKSLYERYQGFLNRCIVQTQLLVDELQGLSGLFARSRSPESPSKKSEQDEVQEIMQLLIKTAVNLKVFCDSLDAIQRPRISVSSAECASSLSAPFSSPGGPPRTERRSARTSRPEVRRNMFFLRTDSDVEDEPDGVIEKVPLLKVKLSTDT